ncbi:MAG: zinc ribbon domain-containing protein [Clostridia bacterium]|nr:zinc ribbon domain-containing protein [Clostridia bacterium]
MVIVYGLRKKLKRVKALGTQVCPNCGHNVEMELAKEGGYAHLCYIPVFPYLGEKFKFCPYCGISTKLTGAEYKAIKKGE